MPDITKRIVASGVFNVYKKAIYLYFTRFFIFSLFSIIAIILSSPIVYLLFDKDSFLKINIALASSEAFVSVFLNSMIAAFMPIILERTKNGLKTMASHYIKYFLSKVLFVAILQSLILFLLVQLLPSLILLVSILLIFSPLFLFYPPVIKVSESFTSGIKLAISNFPKILLFVVLCAVVYGISVFISLLIFSIFGDINVFFEFTQKIKEVSVSNPAETENLLNGLFVSSEFLIAYAILQFIFQPLRAILVYLLFITLSQTNYEKNFQNYLNVFTPKTKDSFGEAIKSWHQK